MKRAIFISILVLVITSLSYAQEINSGTPNNKYDITVKYSDGRPVVNTLVEVIDQETQSVVSRGRTDINGKVLINMYGQEEDHMYLILAQPCGQKVMAYPYGIVPVLIITGEDPC